MEHCDNSNEIGQKSTSERHLKCLSVLGTLSLPFVVFFWLLPFISALTLGKDYAVFPIQHQMELMFSLKMGSFPLYVPGFAGGQSASALMLGQVFHPLPHIATLLPGYWSGNALEWNTLLRLFSLGLAHLVIFVFIRDLGVSKLFSYIVSFITVYNLRMLDLFRYGAALESWTGFLFLCASIGFVCLKPEKSTGLIAIIGSTYWLVCSGHPQMMYYGLIGACVFTVFIPYYIKALRSSGNLEGTMLWKFYTRVGFCVLTGILLSSAFLIPLRFEFIATNAGRIAQSYQWADAFRDTTGGTFNNFFFPLRSDVHGMFGTSSLIILAALLPLLRLFSVKIPRIIWYLWFAGLLIFLYIQGGRLPVHQLAWKYLPFASCIRIAGRISMLMPIIFMLLLTWLLQVSPKSFSFGGREFFLKPSGMATLLSILTILSWLLLPDAITAKTTSNCPLVIRKIPKWVDHYSLILGLTTLIVLFLKETILKRKESFNLALLVLVVIHVSGLLYFGIWTTQKKETQSLQRMIADKQDKLTYRMNTGMGLMSDVVERQVQNAFIEPFLGKIYRSTVFAMNNEEAYRLMKNGRHPDTVILEGQNTGWLSTDKKTSAVSIKGRVELTYSSFNRMVFKIRSQEKAYFGFAYPYSERWKAFVNHESVETYRANGGNIAIAVPAGLSRVEFRYVSIPALLGMAVSCGTLSMISIIFFASKVQRPFSTIAGALILSMCAGLFIVWHHSLYHGRNIATHYMWETTPVGDRPNLAYSKETHMIGVLYSHYPFKYGSGQAVDGYNETPGGFISAYRDRPWWFVDLHEPSILGSIHIYESKRIGILKSRPINARPLKLMISADGEKWEVVKTINDADENRPLVVKLDKPRMARYVLLRASRKCHLAFDEIEVYPACRTEVSNTAVESSLSFKNEKFGRQSNLHDELLHL
jgi:preprotein translocase subunit YajC